MFSEERLRPFFQYASAREKIRMRKEAGHPHPLTDDPILQRYSFCNVFREDDRTTRWFRENVRDVYKDDPYMSAWTTFLFRWFNRIETGAALLSFDLFDDWHPHRCINLLRQTSARGEPVVTGAYMVKTPPDISKLDGVVQCVQLALNDGVLDRVAKATTLQDAHTLFMDAPYVGPFIAYEFVTDLRHTFLCGASDINTWSSPGPGAARGLDRLSGDKLGTRKYGQRAHRESMLLEMQEVLRHSRAGWSWPEKPWELREVEHTLCEFDKYERARAGEGRPKGVYH